MATRLIYSKEKNNMSLYQKYRPNTMEQYVGSYKVPNKARAFLIAGGSGCGKTTLARIVCSERELRVVEINSADNRGIDTARELGEMCKYRPVDGREIGIILDEAHQMTKPTQECLLKYTEDIPDWITWFILTTEPSKIIDTLKQRLQKITIKCPDYDGMKMIVKRAAQGEKFKLDPRDLDRLAQCGSPRIALVQLESLIAGNEIAGDIEEENPEMIALPRAMLAKGDPKAAMQAIRKFIDENRKTQDAESARLICMGYMMAILTKRSDPAAIKWLDLLCQADCWRNKWAALMVAAELYFQT
jgi:DNA polymerase III gamma/tau subunit